MGRSCIQDDHKNVFKMLTGKIPLGRPRHRWEDNIRMGLKEMNY